MTAALRRPAKVPPHNGGTTIARLDRMETEVNRIEPIGERVGALEASVNEFHRETRTTLQGMIHGAETVADTAATAVLQAQKATVASTAAAAAAVEAAAAAHRAATSASDAVRSVSEDNARHIEALKVAVIGGGPLLPDDRGALGHLDEKVDQFMAAAEAREVASAKNRVSKRNFLLALATVIVMFAALLSGVIWNFVALHTGQP